MDAAKRLFAEKGIRDTGVDEIAAAAPVSKMTLYKYFGNKNGLLNAVVDDYLQRLLEKVRASLQASPDPLKALFDFDEKGEGTIPTAFVEELIAHFPEQMQRMMAYYDERVVPFFEDVIYQAQREGQMRKDISPHILMLVMTAIKQHFARPGVLAGLPDVMAVSEQIRTIIYHGIVPDNRKP